MLERDWLQCIRGIGMLKRDWLQCKDPGLMLNLGTEFPCTVTVGASLLGVSNRKLRLFALACALSSDDYMVSERTATKADWKRWATANDRPGEFNSQQAVRYWCGDYIGGSSLKVSEEDKIQRAGILRCLLGNPFRPIQMPNLPDKEIRLLPGELESLAQAAYQEKVKKCDICKNGTRTILVGEGEFKRFDYEQCTHCDGYGIMDDGTLDPQRLMILADALEEAGCVGDKCKNCHGSGEIIVETTNPWLSSANGYSTLTKYHERRDCPHCKKAGRLPHPLLEHLRSPGPHYKGCFAIDTCLSLS